MAFPVSFSDRAQIEYESILEYVLNEFGTESVIEVDLHFEKVIDLIASNPFLFPYSETENEVRRCVISHQTTLYYRFSGNIVEIISFRGNKMKPETLSK